METVATLLTLTVAALLVAGAASDVRTARIPNRLILAGLLLAPLAALAGSGIGGLGTALAATAVAFAIGFIGFALGAIGGGDAKFLMVGAAIVGLPDLVAFLLAAGAVGGALAIGMLVWRRKGLEATVMTLDLAKHAGTLGHKGHRARLGDADRLTVPYGVAIAAAALVSLFTPYADWLLR
jgi:prepilin peptidase CpaA